MKSLKSSGKNRAILLALGAALLAGANAPLAKVLLGSIDPLYLAALLYLGCGSGVYLFRWLRKSARKGEKSEAGLEREDSRTDRDAFQPAGNPRGNRVTTAQF